MRKREGQSEGGALKMPAAVASSVKHPYGIYLTAGHWTSGVLFVPSDLYPSHSPPALLPSCPFCLCFLPPTSTHTTPLRPSVTIADQPPCRQGHSLVQDMCLINEDPDLCYRGGPAAQGGAKSPPLIAQLQRSDKRPWSLILLKADYWPVWISLQP